jgi:hypothetical protein
MLLEAADSVREALGCAPREAVPAMKSRWLLVALAAAGVLVTILGFALQAEGFTGNTLAGLSSLIVGAVLAVALIDHLLRRQHRERWAIARAEICRTICEAVVDMASSFALSVSDDLEFLRLVGPESDPVASPQIWHSLRDLVEATSSAEHMLSSQLEPELASSQTLYEQVAPIVAPLRIATTTRVVVLGDEPRLVAALLNLERAEQRWRDWVYMVEREGAPDGLAWQHATATLRAGADVYGYFLT